MAKTKAPSTSCIAGAVIGGVAGGLIGNAIGQSSYVGRDGDVHDYRDD